MARSLQRLRHPTSESPSEGDRRTTLTIERLNKEVKRRADVVGNFPNEDSIKRLVGAILLGQNDEWQLQHRYMTLETMAGRTDEPATLTHIAA